eukprot:TRINITY_DN1239_c0_g2_i2.p1 TRINITY_DN1239_c0_g2~~TRINITY_DN1239_c0_g2_i2.p1  ORF type:complete len:466 (+),score=98.31 TRINITY_DN1239_c0_g2_i2:316-1713(+)
MAVLTINGAVKSGKTVAAMHIVPKLLARHECFRGLITVYVNLEGLRGSQFTDKLKWFAAALAEAANFALRAAARDAGVVLEQCLTIDFSDPTLGPTAYPISKALARFQEATHVRFPLLVVLDEYQFLFDGLDQQQRAQMGAQMKLLMLSLHTKCVFVVTGSTQPVLWSSLGASARNGMSVVMDQFVITTDFKSAVDSLLDTCAVLQYLLPDLTSGLCTQAIERLTPYSLTCASLHQLVDLLTTHSASSVDEALAVMLRQRAVIYDRDLTDFYREPSVFAQLVALAWGAVQPPSDPSAALLVDKFVEKTEMGYTLTDSLLRTFICTLFDPLNSQPRALQLQSIPWADVHLLFPISATVTQAEKLDAASARAVEDSLWQLASKCHWPGSWEDLVEFLVHTPMNAKASLSPADVTWLCFFRLLRNIVCHDTGAFWVTHNTVEHLVTYFGSSAEVWSVRNHFFELVWRS